MNIIKQKEKKNWMVVILQSEFCLTDSVFPLRVMWLELFLQNT